MGGEELSLRIDGQKIKEGYALVASVLFILNSYCVSTTVLNVPFLIWISKQSAHRLGKTIVNISKEEYTKYSLNIYQLTMKIKQLNFLIN